MSEPSDVKVGDEVRVFDVNGRRMGQPEGGWEGTVEKVGRKLVTISYHYTSKQFRLETRSANDDWAHQSFRTIEECAIADRRKAAAAVLNANGLLLDRFCRLPVETIEQLAALLAAAPSDLSRGKP